MYSKLVASGLILVLLAPLAQACTAFVVYRNGLALAGNNEDFWETDTKIWFVPKSGSQRGVAGKLGRVYFGFKNFYPQGGMNEAGVFFDGFATAENKIRQSTDKPRFDGNIIDHVMANCGTVSEVVAEFEKYNLSFLANAMLMFGDPHGDSVIIEGDNFLRIKGDHQVVTNFYQSLTPAGKCPCSRYLAAVKELGKGDPVSVESCRDVLATTRQNGQAPTQYSNVYDLKQGLIYLYHFHNYQEVVCLDLAEELKKGAHEIDLPSLFSENKAFNTFKSKRQREILNQIETRRAKDVTAIAFEDYVGAFDFDIDGQRTVPGIFTFADNRMYISNDSKTRQEIYPETKDLFFRIGDLGLELYRFERDDHGRVNRVILEVFGRTYSGKKRE